MQVPSAKIWPPDLNKATREERREILQRIRSENISQKTASKAVYAPEDSHKVALIYDFALSIGLKGSEIMLWSRFIAAGGELSIDGQRFYSRNDGVIYSIKKKNETESKKQKEIGVKKSLQLRIDKLKTMIK